MQRLLLLITINRGYQDTNISGSTPQSINKNKSPKYNYDGNNTLDLSLPATYPNPKVYKQKIAVLDLSFSKVQIMRVNEGFSNMATTSEQANNFYDMLTNGNFDGNAPFYDPSWGLNKLFIDKSTTQKSTFFAGIRTAVTSKITEIVKVFSVAANSLKNSQLNTNLVGLRLPFIPTTGEIATKAVSYISPDGVKLVPVTGVAIWAKCGLVIGDNEALGQSFKFEQHIEGTAGFFYSGNLPEVGSSIRFNFNMALCHIATDDFYNNFEAFYRWIGGGQTNRNYTLAFGYGLENWVNDSKSPWTDEKYSKSFNSTGGVVRTFSKSQVDFYTALKKQFRLLMNTMYNNINKLGITMLATTTTSGKMHITFQKQGMGGLQ